MRLHIRSTNFKLWRIIEDGNLVSMDPRMNQLKDEMNLMKKMKR